MSPHQLNGKKYQNELVTAWNHFIHKESYDYSFIRSDVFESWERSRTANVNPYNIVSDILSPDELNVKITNNLDFIEIVRPYMERLYSIIKDIGSYILLTDKNGYILDYVGNNEIVIGEQSVTMLVPGACRMESAAGTNAIGTALFLKKPIQLWGNEHYCEKHKVYTCSCAPILNSEGNIIGAINITVLKEHAHPHTLGMAMSAADSISKEIKLTKALENIKRISAERNTIIENITSGIFLLTSKYRVSQVNRYALNILSLSYEQIIGKNIFDFISFDDNVPGDASQSFLKKERYNEEATVHLLNSNTHPRRFQISVHFIKDNKQNVTGTLLRFNKPELIHSIVKNISGFNAHYTFNDIIGSSDVINKMISNSKKAAQSSSNVLILGESGTGKELIAQAIHNASEASNGPFVAINCASIPNSLVESELFGYEKGAFTGADKNGRPGKFEMANGGTIFLDEIGDMPIDIQAALLRVIQTKEVVRIGGRYPKPICVRIIAATNKNLLREIENKTFRRDLYYRLNVFTIDVPALARRGSADIRLLTDYFIGTFNHDKNKAITISPEVFPLLERYSWPGNVRELENIIERAINLTDEDGIITSDHIPDTLNPGSDAADMSQPMPCGDIHHPPVPLNINHLNLKEHEKTLILSALEQTMGNVTKSAEILNMNIRTLYRKLNKHQIDLSQYRMRFD